MKNIFLAITASLTIVACNDKKETTETTGNPESQSVSNPDSASEVTQSLNENTPVLDSATLKAKEDSIIKAHGHKH